MSIEDSAEKQDFDLGSMHCKFYRQILPSDQSVEEHEDDLQYNQGNSRSN